MGSVPVFPKDPYGGAYGPAAQHTTQVDELIGSAYDVVRYVAENLEYIKHVSYHLKEIYRVFQSIEGIDAIYSRIGDFDQLILYLDQVIIVAENIGDVNLVAGEIEAIGAIGDSLPQLLEIYNNLEAILAHGPSAVIVSPVTPPTPLLQGHLWWNSANGNLYTWFEDNDSGQFVQINTVGGNNKPRQDILSYGAEINGPDAMPAILAMEAAVGYVIVPAGRFTITGTDPTIHTHIYFDPGAVFDIAGGTRLIFQNYITSPEQHIFQGTGTIWLRHDTAVVERSGQSRAVHVSWFGAFTAHQYASYDASPGFVKALAAIGNSNEGQIDIGMGGYSLRTLLPIKVGRGVHINGIGTRRCGFNVTNITGNVFETDDIAVKFTNIQFEVDPAVMAQKDDGYCIYVTHSDFEGYNLACQGCKLIYAHASRTRLDGIDLWHTGTAMPAGSASIHMAGGSSWRVSNISSSTSPGPNIGPEALIRVGGAAANANFIIENVQWITGGIKGVLIDSTYTGGTDVGGFARGTINNIMHTAGITDCAIDINQTSVNPAGELLISNVSTSTGAAAGIRIRQNCPTSPGVLSDIQISNVNVTGSTGIGIAFERTGNSTIEDVYISDTCNLSERATPIAYPAGGYLNIIAPPHLRSAITGPTTIASFFGHAPVTYQVTIPNNEMATINLHRNVFGGVVIVAAGAEFGMFSIRTVASTTITPMITSSTNVAGSGAVLNGTTGPVGRITVGVGVVNMLQFENRLGATINLSITVLRGPPL